MSAQQHHESDSHDDSPPPQPHSESINNSDDATIESHQNLQPCIFTKKPEVTLELPDQQSADNRESQDQEEAQKENQPQCMHIGSYTNDSPQYDASSIPMNSGGAATLVIDSVLQPSPVIPRNINSTDPPVDTTITSTFTQVASYVSDLILSSLSTGEELLLQPSVDSSSANQITYEQQSLPRQQQHLGHSPLLIASPPVAINSEGTMDNFSFSELRQLCTQQKNAVFHYLQEWECIRVNALNIHRSIIENILNRIDQISKQSSDNLKAIIAFINSIGNSFRSINNSTNPTHQSQQSQKPNYAQESPSIYNRVFEGIRLHNEQTVEKNQQVAAFRAFLEQDVLVSLKQELGSRDKKILVIRNNMNTLKLSIIELRTAVNKKYTALCDVYKANSALPQSKRAKKDCQTYLYSFIRECSSLHDLHCILAKATCGYWRKIIEIEIQHAKAIDTALRQLVTLHEELIRKNSGISSMITDEVIELIKGQDFSEERIAECMGFRKLVPKNDQSFIVAQMEIANGNAPFNDISIADVNSYLIKINIPTFDDSVLSLQRVPVVRLAGNQSQKSIVVITPDLFLLCFDVTSGAKANEEYDQSESRASQKEEEEEEKKQKNDENDDDCNDAFMHPLWRKKPDVSFPIKRINLKRDGLTLEVKSAESQSLIQLIRKEENSVRITFHGIQQMQEFMQVLVIAAEKA